MPSAAILAGGRASRFSGRDKSALIVGGLPILDRQMAELEALSDDIMLVVGECAPATVPARLRVVRDRVPACGPLGGLDAALAAARHDALVLVACDMPFVTARLLGHLLALTSEADAIMRGLNAAIIRCAPPTRVPASRHRRTSRPTAAQDDGFFSLMSGFAWCPARSSRRWAISIGCSPTSIRRPSTMDSTWPLVTNCNRITNLPTLRSSR
jgi:CTP:molybdopterin cytidylyltransferase MocA